MSMTSSQQPTETNGDAADSERVDIGNKHKLGHLRVDPQGNATFKRLPTNQLVEALQLGIQFTVGGLETQPARDVLFHDFANEEIINFPKEGRQANRPTPAHRFTDFTIRAYAPFAFRHFREKFNIKPEDFLSSICKPLRELKNPGASGSLFYLTSDDVFIMKTVQKKEAEFLKGLLPGYYMNVTQNPRTLLPKFFGLYCYQVTELLSRNKNGAGDNKNIRITVMNNLIPSDVRMHEKYDLKGSTYKRRANPEERQKESPTWKDLDFMERHPEGLLLDAETYTALAKTVQRDCRVLESFQIMDYSFLIGVHQVTSPSRSSRDLTLHSFPSVDPALQQPKRILYSTPMDSIFPTIDEHPQPDDHLARTGGIPARTANGQKLSLYVGIIDILQSYQLRKKLEHTFKAVLTDGTQISVTHPSFYSERFQKFLFTTVFKKAPPLPDTVIKRQDRPSRRVNTATTTTNNNLEPARDIFHRNGPWKPGYSIPIGRNPTDSLSSTGTSNSRITSYYSSLRSGRGSDSQNPYSSSTTVDVSSYQSDSLFDQPTTRKKSGKVLTSSFNENSAENQRQRFYQDLSRPLRQLSDTRAGLLSAETPSNGRSALSTTHLSSYQRNSYGSTSVHQRTEPDEVTRL